MMFFGQVIEMNTEKTPYVIDSDVLLSMMARRMNADYAGTIEAVHEHADKSADARVKAALAEVVDLLMQRADVYRALDDANTQAQVEMVGYLKQVCKLIGFTKLRGRKIRLLFTESLPQVVSAERCWRFGLAVAEILEILAANTASTNGGLVGIELVTNETMLRCRICHHGLCAEIASLEPGMELVRALIGSLGGVFEFWHDSEMGELAMSVPIRDARYREPRGKWNYA